MRFLTAFRIDVVADRIDDQRAVPGADPGNASSGKKRPTPCHAAPEIGAAVTEGAFIAMELAPNGGMDAVARHENIARLRRQSRTIRADEMCGDPCLVLLDRAAAMTRDEILGSDAVAHRIERGFHQERMAAQDVERSDAPITADDRM